MKRCSRLVLVVLFLLIPNLAVAANHYVRAEASGNGGGSDWTNAWTALPATLTRGDTYYIADGTYSNYSFNDAESGELYITIKKAIESDHGTSTGWDSSYGDGVALFEATSTIFYFSTSYWNIDGQVGSGITGHGIKLNVPDQTLGSIKNLQIANGADYISVSHVEMEGAGEDLGLLEGEGPYSRPDGIYINCASSNLTFSYCYVHDFSRCPVLLSSVSDIVIEYCWLGRAHNDGSGAIPHMQTIQGGPGATQDITIRYSTLTDTLGTGMIVALDATHTGWKIYGNIFYHTAAKYYNCPEAIGNTSGDTATGMDVYNNTFVNLNNVGAGGIRWENGSNNYTYNNVIINCDWGAGRGDVHDYNLYDDGANGETNGQHWTSSPQDLFLDYSNRDYALKVPTDAGSNLPPPYDQDITAVTRGADGNWDRGTFEYSGAPDFPPEAPQSFRITQ